jgi:hypothetical protein
MDRIRKEKRVHAAEQRRGKKKKRIFIHEKTRKDTKTRKEKSRIDTNGRREWTRRAAIFHFGRIRLSWKR